MSHLSNLTNSGRDAGTHITRIAGHRVEVDVWLDGGAQRVDCFITSRDGRYQNSLALLEDLGAFDDGPVISRSILDAARTYAERFGY